MCHFAVAARCKNNSASDEDTGIIDEIEFQDFSPFLSTYHKYKKDISDTAKIAFMTNGWILSGTMNL